MALWIHMILSGVRPHSLPMARLARWKSLLALAHLSLIWAVQRRDLSRVRPRYLTVSVKGSGGVVDGEIGVVKIFPGLPTGVFKEAFGFLRIIG